MQVSETGLNLVKRFEGLSTMAYRCPAGVLTIGYGHTSGVSEGDTLTEEACTELLKDELRLYANLVLACITVPLTQHQLDALTSFTFNVGIGAFKSSTALRKINASDFDAVPAELLRWDKATVGGELTVLKGLVRRRTAEAALFAMDETLADDGGKPMAQNVSEANPPELKKLTKSKTLAGASLAGASVGLAEVAVQLKPFIMYSDYIKYLFLALSLGGVALVAYARLTDRTKGVH
tara:strand:- start:2032 stop:2739 length:708 start_codon:yes stop_codon:yes gene_type:complete